MENTEVKALGMVKEMETMVGYDAAHKAIQSYRGKKL